MTQAPIYFKRVSPALLMGLLLFVVTAWLYWPTTDYSLLIYDDDRYVTDNGWMKVGLSVGSLRWAFTTLDAEFWHPLTWVSYLIDASVYGLFPGGYHLTNLLLHSLNTVLLFLCLHRLTRLLWPAALVAALFGWHPLHVESVAWVAERKDLLSALFMFLTLLAYVRYVEKLKAQNSGTKSSYALALFLFACGLMSKPMLVTLPCVLLLLDYWPLGRFAICDLRFANFRSRASLVLEKIPFFALALFVGALTIVAQQAGGSLKSAEQVPISLRALNALVAYASYLCNTIWPAKLCVFYPLPRELPVGPALGAALLLAAISLLVWRRRATAAWLLVGWLWFLGMLVPVIGLIQVGSHAMADRYTYLPLVGVFLMVAWGAVRWVELNPSHRTSVSLVAGGVLILCLSTTRAQMAYWRDSVTLFEREVSVVGGNALVWGNLGVALSYAGRSHEAVACYEMALAIAPSDAGAHANLGGELAVLERFQEAEPHLQVALNRKVGGGRPLAEELHNNLGIVQVRLGKTNEAIAHFQQAIAINPGYARPYFNHGMALERQGLLAEAVVNYEKAAQIDPDWLACLDALAGVYAASGDYPKAVTTAELTRRKASAMGLQQLVATLDGKVAAYKAGQLPSRNPNPQNPNPGPR